jgi:hypothetical protein
MILLAFQVNAQLSRFLEKGNGGIGIQASVTHKTGYTGAQGKLSGSIKGKLDAEFLYSYNLNSKEANRLTTDQSSYFYYEGRLTYWIFREKVTQGIDVNVGALAAVDIARFKDQKFINTETGNEREFNRYGGVALGVEGSVNFQINQSWSLQPSFMAWFEVGKQAATELGNEQISWYNSLINNFGLSLTKKLQNGNAFYTSVILNNWGNGAYTISSVYELALGYVFKM